MKSKIFSTDQVRAIQDGRMTQFMQVMKPQPTDDWMQNTKQFSSDGSMFDKKGKQLFWLNDPTGKRDEIYPPFGKVGSDQVNYSGCGKNLFFELLDYWTTCSLAKEEQKKINRL